MTTHTHGSKTLVLACVFLMAGTIHDHAKGATLYAEDFESATPGQSLVDPPLGWSVLAGSDICVQQDIHPGWTGNAILGNATTSNVDGTRLRKDINNIPTTGLVTISFKAWAYTNHYAGGGIYLTQSTDMGLVHNIAWLHWRNYSGVNDQWMFAGVAGSWIWVSDPYFLANETVIGVIKIDYDAGELWGELLHEDGSLAAQTPKSTFSDPPQIVGLEVYEDVRSDAVGIDIDDIMVEWTSSAIPVLIDVKPGDDLNAINLRSNGVVPVAILTTDDFDATTVDPGTVELAGSRIAIRGKGDKLLASEEDVDGDGDIDLLAHVETENLDLPTGTTEVILTGQTYNGQDIEGSDTVVIVKE